MVDARELTQRLDLCLRVGEMLLASGAGAADVTATMRALAHGLGVRRTEVDVTFTQLAMSAQAEPDEPAIVQIRSVTQREIDYDDLTKVDHLVRDVLAERVGLREARAEIARIASSGHARPRWAATIGWGLMCAGIGLQLGGSPAVVAVAFVAAVCIDRLQHAMTKRRLPVFYQQVAGGAVATLLAAVVTRAAEPVVTMDASLVVSANIIMLLAGIGFMGAIQDAMSGFYVTGSARLLEAVLATAGIIAGVSGGLSLATAVGLDLPPLEPARGDLVGVSVAALGAAVAAAAFAFSSYAPLRTLAPVGLLAGGALGITEAVARQDFGRPWAVGIAAFAVGLVSYTVAGRLRVPPLVVVVSAVVPLLPGLSIYRGLSLLGAHTDPAPAQGLLAMVTAASVATALAAGVILGEYVAQPVKREARRVETRLAGPRLVGVTRHRRRRGRGSGQSED
ncbi:threonine/serine ThrE exporter family protein [Nocardioides antri]|uniref:Threonine/serine exporter family protein n=1 Tax=Nocardioides antri TaxID=2607659 RepID=A0A5B1LZC6_9ACTN|nr:threonine/serine exporter family protein [Nocardioides antri]KAA1425901.1 threonine/serine exporter family protein [Nocardioides antri]